MVDRAGVFLKKTWFITSRTGKIEQYYDFDPKKVIGSGTYGNVIKATMKGTKSKRAIKIIAKSKVKNKARFQNEIEIMKKLDHPNVIKLYESFEDNRNVYLVMEMCDGGELFDMIIDKGHFTENEARNIFRQIMLALNYCHQNGIAHRDLKPENFLLLTKSPDSPIKVIDFGLSKVFDDNNQTKLSMQTKAGTPYYISPEVLNGDYDESCDIWSAGVILYILLSGVPPFYGNTDADILESVKMGKYSFDIPEFKVVSSSAKDLITKMLKKPKERLKSHQVIEHPWMKEDFQKQSNLKVNFSTLKNYKNHEKLKKAALSYIASQLSEQEITQLGKLFQSLDKNGDGVLTVDEIKYGIENADSEDIKKLQEIFASIDSDGSGVIQYTEFLAATMDRNVYMKEEKLFMTFKLFDADGSGKISANELKQILGKEQGFKDQGSNYWDQMIKEVDKNGDGEIDYSEFIEMMNKQKK